MRKNYSTVTLQQKLGEAPQARYKENFYYFKTKTA